MPAAGANINCTEAVGAGFSLPSSAWIAPNAFEELASAAIKLVASKLSATAAVVKVVLSFVQPRVAVPSSFRPAVSVVFAVTVLPAVARH